MPRGLGFASPVFSGGGGRQLLRCGRSLGQAQEVRVEYPQLSGFHPCSNLPASPRAYS